MRFVPYYTVSYHGKFYRAGVEFEIDDADANFMKKHGVITDVTPPETDQTSQAESASLEKEKPVKRVGRPRKQS